MSVVGFEVHVDKENVTSAPSIISKEGALKNSGLKGDSWKLQHTAPRKALLDVINEPTNRTAIRDKWGKQLILTKDSKSSSTKTQHKISSGAENVCIHITNKKQGSKSPSLHKGLKVLKDAEPQLFKAKPMVTQNKPQALPRPQTEPEINDDDCECDSIFPKSERLSSYVSKLLTWRPPCLFGIHPDTESDNSDIEELTLDDLLLDMPLFMPMVPEFSDKDLAHLMNEFPPQKPDYKDHEPCICENKDIEMSFDLTNDTSFSFGTLHFINGSLDNSQISDASSPSDLDNTTSCKESQQ